MKAFPKSLMLPFRKGPALARLLLLTPALSQFSRSGAAGARAPGRQAWAGVGQGCFPWPPALPSLRTQLLHAAPGLPSWREHFRTSVLSACCAARRWEREQKTKGLLRPSCALQRGRGPQAWRAELVPTVPAPLPIPAAVSSAGSSLSPGPSRSGLGPLAASFSA